MQGTKKFWRLLALVVTIAGFGAAFASPAAAEDTVWLCKPGDPQDLCAGTIAGETLPGPGQTAAPLGYTRPADAPVDCFYLYPTQSEQDTPNSNLEKDPPIRRVGVQQARMFSSICDVYAPMYRQVTYNGSQANYNPDVETAYQSALSGFKDYLANYNAGRGFILIGHSQGSAHTARLINEEIDNNPELRDRMVGAIAPGANISVPTGKLVGGMYANVPACSAAGEIGCLIAFSTYKGYPGDTAQYSRLNSGYWIHKEPRPDPDANEVVCVNPAALDGSNGVLKPLINTDYLTGVPAGGETAAPWRGMPDFYRAECQRQNGAHWLNLSTVDQPGETRPDLAALLVNNGSNYHVPEVNLTEGNLIAVAKTQADAYVAREAARKAEADKAAKRAAAIAARPGVEAKLNAAKASYKKRRVEVLKSNRLLKKATRKCKKAKAKRANAKAKRAACKPKRRLTRKKATAAKKAKQLNIQITDLTKELSDLDAVINQA